MAATACCTSTAGFYQPSLVASMSQFKPVLRRTTVPSSSSSSIVHVEQPSSSSSSSSLLIKPTMKSDDNNNYEDTRSIFDDILYITSDDDDDDLDDDLDVQCLTFVGLRRKTIRPSLVVGSLRPLTKKLAGPVCLLPLPKHIERVRQALNIKLPFLKFLSITHDLEHFCCTDENTPIAQTLLPRKTTTTTTTQSRTLTIHKRTKKQRIPKTELIAMAAASLRNNNPKTVMAKCIQSTLQCQVVLDRLEQSTLDQIMCNTTNIATVSTIPIRTLRNAQIVAKEPVQKARRSLAIATKRTTTTTTTRTTITTMTTEKTVVKRKSASRDYVEPKRQKIENDDSNNSNSNDDDCIVLCEEKMMNSSGFYQRIYLKCFVCSKRSYIDAQATTSDALHSHWLEHDADLSLNIYDSEIDSILTRVVEFFHLPKRHTLEGKIKTVFILNSKEVRRTLPESITDDTCIVLD